MFEFPLRFPGQYADKETNLYYNFFRDYDPSLGRYSESDPIGMVGGPNTYAYAYSGPVSNLDPDGRLGLGGAVLLVALVGMAAEGGATLISNACRGVPLTTNLPGALIGGFIEGAVVGVVAIAPAPTVATIGLTTALFPSVARTITGIIVGTAGNTILVGKILGSQ
jgi:RHS repeat-associated protein